MAAAPGATVDVPANEMTATFTVETLPDMLAETDETFMVTLTQLVPDGVVFLTELTERRQRQRSRSWTTKS